MAGESCLGKLLWIEEDFFVEKFQVTVLLYSILHSKTDITLYINNLILRNKFIYISVE